jgi:glyoxylase-like metal-dependent hydrolase (beta-lactamase superfamily II)
MELIKLEGNTWVIRGPVNIGVFVKGTEAILIDSGNDSSAGRKILHFAEDKNWNIKWIINTHFHADHTGGNSFIQKRTKCGIAASPKEAPFIDFPEMEPEILWCGTAPKMLRNKFLQAEQSKVTKLLDPGDTLEDYGIEILNLPGHAHGQIGIRTADNVIFTADSIIAEHILNKYGIPFVADFELAMSTFNVLENMEANLFVPSHGDVCSDIKEMIQANRKCLQLLMEEIIGICTLPAGIDDIIAALSVRHGISMTMSQYVLARGTVAAITSHLIDSGEVTPGYDSGSLKLRSRE